ncbi:uncharacterized protein LOC111697736 isoform X2 [Eurytemora carolleeae]|uniref:uncharacterized protein LOC111697736 isoform X1 n=1 Tax=Eurytemora carolleeae TaxID=1294199 RepID=UPI000C778F68|nr:uncharacterized protein LOC111697736 isoform X1 [Eurytemora carolleeae]XP_023323605.1 uncharacterized protein LOC111697736 isoform X2 [Eurytemora carolleeae]|eukprot:XP_023323603.1 uncharacterized protein LOC111697736 isoform X1 [Eurytemora affinis]
MAGINTFPVILQLYNKCRGAGIWAKMVLEAENGKETITFSSVTKPVAAASLTPAPGRRKKPSKVKKDRKRKEAWLEKRSQGKEKPSQTGEISTPEEAWLKSTAELESYTQPGFVRSDQQVKPVQPNTNFTDPCSTETLCSTLCSTEKEKNTRAEEAAQNSGDIIRTPGGTSLAVLQPVPAVKGGSVSSEHTSLVPGTQLGDTTDFDMDTHMIRIEKEDRNSLCAKCDGRPAWSPIYRSETICNTECAWVALETNIKSSTRWVEPIHMKECKSNPHKKINKHLVNFSVCLKCENLFDYECNPACPQAKSKHPCVQ